MKTLPDMCNYYQAHIVRKHTWFVVAVLKSFEHVAFDRTVNVEENLLEFFVPLSMDVYFRLVMDYCITHDIVTNFKQLPNRLLDPTELV